jgi:predicted short-subunit dehydrogenase-like oxidoreductase (DUF2520 family)
MRAKPRIAIVGAGNLGTALALSLHRAGYGIETIVARSGGKSLQQARSLAKAVGAKAVVSAADVKSELVWFCVPDSETARAARAFAVHSSGALTSDELALLRRRGAAVASVHPLMTFVQGSRPLLSGVPFAIEGDAGAVRLARTIVQELGGVPYTIRKQDKAAYHAWGTFASPLLTALLAVTEEVAKLSGVRGEAAKGRMIPILRQTLANYAEFGAARGVSGPIIRGDVETVKRHLKVLRGIPAARDVYSVLAQAALQYLPAKNKEALRRLLAGRD